MSTPDYPLAHRARIRALPARPPDQLRRRRPRPAPPRNGGQGSPGPPRPCCYQDPRRCSRRRPGEGDRVPRRVPRCSGRPAQPRRSATPGLCRQHLPQQHGNPTRPPGRCAADARPVIHPLLKPRASSAPICRMSTRWRGANAARRHHPIRLHRGKVRGAAGESTRGCYPRATAHPLPGRWWTLVAACLDDCEMCSTPNCRTRRQVTGVCARRDRAHFHS